LLASLAVPLAGGSPLATPIARAAAQKRLILFQQGDRSRTPSLVANRRHVESLPFDGLMIHIPQSWSVMTGKRFAPFDEWYRDWLAPLETLWRRPMHNLLLAFIDRPGDLFDDAAWDLTIENWRDLARGAAQAGFAGIAYDNEQYRGRWHDFPEDHPGADAADLPRYRERATVLGRRVMEAVVAEFPTAEKLVFHGPYVSEPATPGYVVRNQVAGAASYELLGPFFVGMLLGAAGVRVIDGGEVYQYRAARDFARSYDWRKRGIASAETDSAFIPPDLRARWAAAVSVSYGVYNRSWPDRDKDRMTPAIMERTLTNALRAADDTVWCFTEGDNWLVPGRMPQAWSRAVRRARRAADA
jgi:hypothetical protein